MTFTTGSSIIVGTVYHIFHEEFVTDEQFFKRADRDIELMTAAGINHVMIFPMSQWDPDTKELVWTRTDYIVRRIESCGMKFVPLLLKEEQCSHYFPIWKFSEIEGLWQQYNLKNGNKNNRENLDFADPRVYPLVEEYFKAVIGRYGSSPALAFYNIWNEPHYSSNAEHVMERYRNWLKKRYGTLPALRRSWGKEYNNWLQVSPFLNDNWDSSMPQIDWKIFRNELNGILLGELIQTLRRYDKTHAVNANSVGTTWMSFKDFGSYDVDDLPLADKNDIHGISYYPDIWEREHGNEEVPFWLHNLAFNAVRCSAGNKDYILTELFTNAQNGLALNGYLTKDAVTLLAWTALSNDCKGLVYWKWRPFTRGRQSLGRGLCRVDGELAPRGEAVRDLGAVVQRYGEVLRRAHLRKAEVAVLVDVVGLIKTLEQTTEMATNKFMYESYAGIFKAFHEANIVTDIVRMDRGIDLKSLEQYRIIFLPFQIVMQRECAEVLKEYVKLGGWIVADARTATIDELDFAYTTSPGAGLDDVFGATRTDWIASDKNSRIRINAAVKKEAFQFEGRYFREHLHPRSSVNILGSFVDNGEVAVTQNRYGKGRAILCAVPLGASYFKRTDNPVNRLVLSFASVAGVTLGTKFNSNDHSYLDVKVHETETARIVYVINSQDTPKSGSLELDCDGLEVHSVKDIISDTELQFARQTSTIAVPLKIRQYQVVVLLVE